MKTAACLAFLAGVLVTNWWYRAELAAAGKQLRSMDAQIESALGEVRHAHELMDQLEGCHLRGADPVVFAAYGDRND